MKKNGRLKRRDSSHIIFSQNQPTYFAFYFILKLFLLLFVFLQVEVGATGHGQLLDQPFHLSFLFLFLLHFQLLVLPPVIDDTLWS